MHDGAAKPEGARVLHGPEPRDLRLQGLQDRPGGILASVIDDDDLMGHLLALELRVEVAQGLRQRLGLVPRGNDDRIQREAHPSGAERSSQSGWVPAWTAISSRTDWRGVLGFQPQTRPAFEGSSTIQGMSKGRCEGSAATGWGPKRSAHHSVNWRSEMADCAPPPTFTTLSPPVDLRRRKLRDEEGDEVGGMQAVAHLVALAAESDVLEGPPAQVAVDPVGEDPLVRPAELPGAGEDAAAVDEDGQGEGLAVFQGERLARELCRPVERNRRRGGEGFGDAECAYARRAGRPLPGLNAPSDTCTPRAARGATL